MWPQGRMNRCSFPWKQHKKKKTASLSVACMCPYTPSSSRFGLRRKQPPAVLAFGALTFPWRFLQRGEGEGERKKGGEHHYSAFRLNENGHKDSAEGKRQRQRIKKAEGRNGEGE